MFETPLFLLAALVGGMIPLLLHMMQKRQALPVPFPTLRFLKTAQKSASRSVRIEHWLLWLLRTLIMLLLGTAFAMPVLRTGGGGFLGRAPRDIAIVLDTSYSMGYQAGRDTVFDRAIEMAADLIGGLGENDRFCIYLAGDKPKALVAEPVSDRETGLAQIKALRPRFGSSQLLPAVEAARDALFKSAGRRQLELHVLTDNQALAWSLPGGAAASADTGDSTPDRRLSVFVTLAGVPAPENVAPQGIELMPPVLFQGGGARLTVRLDQTGPPRETTATFYLDGTEQARRSVTTGTPASQQIIFAVPPLEAGTHVGRIEVPTDNLPADDVFHFLVRVRDRMPTLIAGAESDTFFLRAALRAAAGGDAAFTVVAPEALGDAKLGDFASLFLCNALPLPGQTVSAVERFVQRGGLLVVFPGSRAAITDYQAWSCLPGVPQGIADVPRAQARQTLIWNAPTHPVLQTLGDAMADPVVAVQRILTWESTNSVAIPLVSLSSGLPMLLERPFGDGRVIMSGVAADRSGSSFPLTPFFLPLVAQLVEYGAGLGGVPPFIWGSEQLSLDTFLSDAPPGSRLTGPQGLPLPVRSMVQEGQTSLYLEDATEPGIYAQDRDGGPQPMLAVNMPREESNLTPLDAAAVAKLPMMEKANVAVDRESLALLIQQHRVGRTYGELLLWIILALLVAEFLYANRLARSRGLLSDQLTIDMSGRVRGHIHAAADGEGG
jgi:hypothetical protein